MPPISKLTVEGETVSNRKSRAIGEDTRAGYFSVALVERLNNKQYGKAGPIWPIGPGCRLLLQGRHGRNLSHCVHSQGQRENKHTLA